MLRLPKLGTKFKIRSKLLLHIKLFPFPNSFRLKWMRSCRNLLRDCCINLHIDHITCSAVIHILDCVCVFLFLSFNGLPFGLKCTLRVERD